MPTISGIRRRGYTPEAIRNFCNSLGVSKTNGIIELRLLEHHVREDLNKRAPRMMAVLRPLRVVIDNYPEGQTEEVEAVNNPEDASAGTRKVPFSRVLYIEQDDFREDPPKQYYRLSPGREVRLRYAYFITCTSVVKDENGEVVEIHCTYDPATRGGNAPGRPESEIHHPLGLGRARRRCRSAPLRDSLHARRSQAKATTSSNPDIARNPDRRANSNRRSAQRRSHGALSSSSASATSASIPTPRPAIRSSTGPWR